MSSGSGCRRIGLAMCVALASALASAAAAQTALANTYKAHDGPSLSAAVDSANGQSGPSTIELSPGTYLPQSTLTIRADVTLLGPASAPGVKIDGGSVQPVQQSDLFSVSAHAKATFVNVLITTGGWQGSASAINDFGTVDLESSTLSGNNGPGLNVQPGANATLRNSTLSEGLDAGLIDKGSAKLVNVTVAGNNGGGIDNGGGSLSLVNTIVARNTSPDCSAHASASDQSLDGDGSCGVGALSHLDPKLGPLLQSNGGPTPTRALLAGSPAIDAGDNAQCPTDDQRHYARDGTCDIGAYEANAVPGPSSGSGSGSGGGAGGGSGRGLRHGKHRFIGVSARGALRGRRHSRIAFSIRALSGQSHGRFNYDDAAGHVRLRALAITSLKIDSGGSAATIRGLATAADKKRVSFTAVLSSHSKRRSLRIRLSNGYSKSGSLVSGAITFMRS